MQAIELYRLLVSWYSGERCTRDFILGGGLKRELKGGVGFRGEYRNWGRFIYVLVEIVRFMDLFRLVVFFWIEF